MPLFLDHYLVFFIHYVVLVAFTLQAQKTICDTVNITAAPQCKLRGMKGTCQSGRSLISKAKYVEKGNTTRKKGGWFAVQ